MDEYDGNTSNEELMDSIPLDIELTEGNTATELPPKSMKKYNVCYDQFMKWKRSNNIDEISEKVMLSYFNELKGKFQATTLWSYFSMLRSTLLLKNNTNIRNYTKLIKFLKQNSQGYQSKKSEVFKPADLKKFFEEAPDAEYLLEKVVAIFGICGACRVEEITYMKTDDVKDRTDVYVINVPDGKSKVPRQFIVGSEFYKIVKKYVQLRPKETDTSRFFLAYKNGECTAHHIGRNKIALFPKKIAQYLKLANPELYTGYSFKRISPTLLDPGADLSSPATRHGGRKLDRESITNIRNSLQKISKIENQIVSAVKQQGTVEGQQGRKELYNQTLEIHASTSENSTKESTTAQSSPNKPVGIALYNCTIIIQN